MVQVEFLGSFLKPCEGRWMATVNQAILDLRGKPLIVASIQCILIKTGDCGILVEIYVILVQMMVIFHHQVVKFVGGRGDWVWFSEGGIESVFKVFPFMSVSW